MSQDEREAVAAMVRKMTALRHEALTEIAAAGDAGLGFGRCCLKKRRELLKLGLTERLPHTGGFSAPLRERLTPLGHAVLTAKGRAMQ